jgi:uncharacterized protein YyaL (SSP411 family)
MRTLPGADPLPAELETRLRSVLATRRGQRPRSRHLEASGAPRFTNRLALEASPYLLQHAHNPVNWHPWGDEAFAEARRLDRPVFLSIGYSTCHWCHVMEEESFEDEAIAAVLNAHYVPIKVDREERPDVDAVYMRVAQRLTGSGGWPLSVWLTADREPFFAGTYFPPYAGLRGAEVGFIDLLTELARLYREDGARVHEAARSLAGAVRAGTETVLPVARSAESTPDLDLVAAAVAECRRGFDERHGGLLRRQKFPSHVPVRLLLRHHQRTGDAQALHMAVRTLAAMAAGGIYDHLAGGFHRYATDPEWLVPHFEKMLYDNALLIVAYTEAWQVTKREDFARVVRETCDELLATFASPEGGFYSATDADSEGEEGKYFVWSEDQIRAVLGAGEETELFLRHYGVTAGGNHELGNVLAQVEANEEVTRRLAPARSKLAKARSQRVPPLRDEKILAAWNGLALSAFAVAGRVFAEPRYFDAAAGAAEFVLGRMRDPASGQLARSYCAGHLGAPGFLDDYACVAAGLLDLFESTNEARWFHEACRLCDQVEARFADARAGGWFMVGDEHERLLARERPMFDGAEPAGSSIVLMNAARLVAYTDDERWRKVTERALAFSRPMLEANPLAMAEALLAVDFLAGPVREIVIAYSASDPGSLHPFRQVLRDTFCPRKVLVVGEPTSSGWRTLESSIPLLRGKVARDGRVTAYVCTRGHCELPTTDPQQFLSQIVG